MIKVLVVDDSALVRKLLGKVFSEEPGFEVVFARDGLEALAMLAEHRPDVVTLDIHMPQLDGLATLDRIMLERPCPVVMVSALTAEGAEVTLEALRLGAVDFLPKPGGAVSLKMDEFAPEVIAKVRSAASARLPATRRLAERIRHRVSGAAPAVPAGRRRESAQARIAPASGMGVVLIGTSTGGPPALEAVLTRLPEGFPWPIVIAQHMPSSFTGPLARRLNGLSNIEVVEVTTKAVLEPGYAYIARGDADIVLANRAGQLVAISTPSEPGYPWHPSTDRLVRSALDAAPSSPMPVMRIPISCSAGGRTIAEAEETAVVWGMPGELVKAGGADIIAPVNEIAARLQEIAPPCR